jgi:spermidine/putrescine transport system permease protein
MMVGDELALGCGETTTDRYVRAPLRQQPGLLTRWRESESARGYLLLSPALLIVGILLLVPLAALLALSFASQNYFDIDYTPTLGNYETIFAPAPEPAYFLGIPFYLESPIFLVLLVKSILMSLASTLAVVLLAYPMAYFLAFQVKRGKFIWIILITLPFWTSYLLRVFSWKIILGFNGVVNSGLMDLGIITQPLEFLLYNPAAVVITLAHAWAAFAILPIYVSLDKIDRSLFEAATDLGDNWLHRFCRITLPLSLPGVAAAAMLVFIPTVGDYVTPTLVGGTEGLMIGNVVQSQFGKANNAPLGAAISIVSMTIVALAVLLFLWAIGRRKRKGA